MPVCPHGHDSADDEFCDVGGLAFEKAAPVALAERAPEPARPCPSCGAQLDERFCENCGADSLAAPVAAEPVARVATWSVVVPADERYFRAVKAEGDRMPARSGSRRSARSAGSAWKADRSRSGARATRVASRRRST